MAIITKIRERSGVAVFLIALSLILFIVGSDILGGRSLFSGGDDSVGEIAGEKVLYADYMAKVQEATNNLQMSQNRAPSEQETQQIRQQIWEKFINDIAYQKEFDALGIKVGDDELYDMVQGKNVHPSIKQQFTNPQTGIFDKNQVVQYLKNLKTQGTAQEKEQWVKYEKSLAESRVREKYDNLFSLSTNASSFEGKREYETQTATTTAKYLFVPYSSIIDSTIKVEDSQLKDYLAAHKDRYKGYDSRSLEYVIFNVFATKEDTASFYEQIKDLAKGLGSATNDSAYAASNSEVVSPSAYSLAEIPESIKANMGTFNINGVYGPFKDGDQYSIVKYKGIARDTNYTVRASHILFQFTDKSDSAKALVRARAQGVLNQIKGGADFAQMASMNGSDGTAQKGGDLGYFKNNGSMVKPFEQAVFAYNGTGLLPNLVETDFGYHIIKVTEGKTNSKYRMSIISKILGPSQQTRDAAYAKAEKFAAENQSTEKFKEAVKKEKLVSLTAKNIMDNATTINGMNNAREIVMWAFKKDVEKGDVSNAFELGNNYLVANVTDATYKDSPSIEEYRDELKFRVIRDLKAEKIAAKLKGITGTLEQIAQKYGAGALVETAENINLATGVLKSAGADAVAVGKAFGLKPGQKSGVLKGESGMFIVEGTPVTAAPAIADFTQYKSQIVGRNRGSASYYASEVIKENAKIVDKKARFF